MEIIDKAYSSEDGKTEIGHLVILSEKDLYLLEKALIHLSPFKKFEEETMSAQMGRIRHTARLLNQVHEMTKDY